VDVAVAVAETASWWPHAGATPTARCWCKRKPWGLGPVEARQ